MGSILPRLPPGKVALAASWFRSIRDRIEEIKPKEGRFIYVESTDNGQIIHLDTKVYELTVCKNGLPETIKVFGVKGDLSEYDKSFID